MSATLPQHDAVPGALRAVKRRLPAPVKSSGRMVLRRAAVATSSAAQRTPNARSASASASAAVNRTASSGTVVPRTEVRCS